MNIKKLLLSGLTLAMLGGCGAPELTAPILKKDSLSTRLAATSTPNIFAFPSFKPASGSKLVGSGTYKGFSFKGSATVNRFDERSVDLLLNVRKALVINADVHLVIAAQEDGTIKVVAKRLDAAPSNPGEVSKLLKILKVEANRSVFEYTDGKQVIVSVQTGSDGRDSLTVVYADCTVNLGQAI